MMGDDRDTRHPGRETSFMLQSDATNSGDANTQPIPKYH